MSAIARVAATQFRPGVSRSFHHSSITSSSPSIEKKTHSCTLFIIRRSEDTHSAQAHYLAGNDTFTFKRALDKAKELGPNSNAQVLLSTNVSALTKSQLDTFNASNVTLSDTYLSELHIDEKTNKPIRIVLKDGAGNCYKNLISSVFIANCPNEILLSKYAGSWTKV